MSRYWSGAETVHPTLPSSLTRNSFLSLHTPPKSARIRRVLFGELWSAALIGRYADGVAELRN
jgi:hypothetical protein